MPGLTAMESGYWWPRCPQCSRPRLTACPACHTAGSRFDVADLPPWRGQAGDPEAAGLANPAPAEAAEASAPVGPPLVICPICDEPFAPHYLRRCEWCGHDFGEGSEPPEMIEAESTLNGRVLAVMAGLAALLLGLWLYVQAVLRR